MGRQRRTGFQAAIGVALAATVSGTAFALPTEDDDIGMVVQTLADLTLIDGACRNVVVNFGIGFTFASEHGLSPAAVMPTGPMRKAFVADLDRSAATYTPDTTCGALAEHYTIAVPGSVTVPSSGRNNGS